MIRKVWESRNFMEFNNWCQITKCKLNFVEKELPDKKWRTTLTIIDEKRILNKTITGAGIGHNKKESKSLAMREAMENLMNFNMIQLGIKDKRFITEYHQIVKNENFIQELEISTPYSTNKSLLASPPKEKKLFENSFQIQELQPNSSQETNESENIEVPREVEAIINGNKANVLTKKIIKEIKEGKFEECCGYLEEIIKLKNLEWIEFANIWNYSLEKKNIRYIRKLIDIISSIELENGDQNLNLENQLVEVT
jgi:hypothetical protein